MQPTLAAGSSKFLPESSGKTTLALHSIAEALEITDREHGHIDLAVSDVVMPGMDGPALLGHLRERYPSIRIVFMSGYAEEAFRKNLGEDEDFIFLPKPFTLKKLAETVKAAAP
jgi:two-component system cell cycle sensor histidine kinase/response regulator CckA